MNTAEQYRINKLKSLKAGDTVYLVPHDTRYQPCIREILSVGTKWLKLDLMHKSENRFDITNGYKHMPDLGSSSYIIHASEEDYKIFCNMREEHFKLLQEVDILKNKSDIDTLRKIIKRWNKLIIRQS